MSYSSQAEERRTSKSGTPQASFDTIDSDSDEDLERELVMAQKRRRVNLPAMRQKLTGHRNARTMIKVKIPLLGIHISIPIQEAAWWGKDFILSGSDCGHLFAWDRNTGECVAMIEADRCIT